MKITVCAGEYGADKQSERGNSLLKTEYALGLFIQTQKHRCLFDFGNKTEKDNLAALGISAKSADLCVLSHGHIGAGGGLEKLKSEIGGAKLYARETAFEPHYFKKSRWNYKTVSLPKKVLREKGNGFIFTKSFLRIDEDTAIIGNFKIDKKELAVGRYFVDGEKYFETDTFLHEQALLVTEGTKTVLFVGGAHAGLKNIIERAENTFSRRVTAVVGALALTDKKGKALFDKEYIDNFAYVAEKFTAADFYIACGAGDGVFSSLQEQLGRRIRRLCVGETKEL